MTTIFQLDPRVLDDCVSDSTPDVEIEAEAAAYFRSGQETYGDKVHAYPRSYIFYLDSIVGSNVPSPLLELLPQLSQLPRLRSVRERGYMALTFKRADVVFMPVSDVDKSRRGREALYADGKFLEGDADTFRNYGITIKP